MDVDVMRVQMILDEFISFFEKAAQTMLPEDASNIDQEGMEAMIGVLSMMKIVFVAQKAVESLATEYGPKKDDQ